MFDWHPADRNFADLFHGAQSMGSDTSPVNIYLFGPKNHTETAVQDGILFRYYDGGAANVRGYGFPLSGADFDGGRILALLRLDAERRGVPLAFCACDEKQRKFLDGHCRIRWSTNDGDGDYIYKRESLAKLSGKKLHAKKNHVNKFWRTYTSAEYRPLSQETVADAVRVAEQWVEEREPEDSYGEELMNIRKAAENWEMMGIFGGLLYVGDEPVAMTMASAISPQCIDVHYEKAVGEFASYGAYAAVNQAFTASEAAAPYVYVNREEDMGLPGLRQAKESYCPAYKLAKFYGTAE